MGNHALDPLELAVGGGDGISQHQLRVEDVEAFVLHRAHVEMAHRHDVELIEVVLQPIHPLIPGHGAFEGGHGVIGVGGVAGLHVQAQPHRAAGGGGEAATHLLQPAGHQGEEVTGLGEGVVPDGVVAAVGQGAALQAVAVGEQHRSGGLVGLDPHLEAAEQVRAVGMEADAPEPLGFALGGEHPAAGIEPFQGGVGLRLDPHPAGEHEWPRRWRQDHQPITLQLVGAGGEGFPINCQLQQVKGHPAQLQGLGRGRTARAPGQAGVHLGVVVEQPDREVGAIELEGERPVVSQTHRGAGGGHGGQAGARP